MSHVFVLDTLRQPLNPVHPGRARWLLARRKAAVLKRYPFTIILLNAVESPQVQPLRLKLDPGSQTTGIAIVDDHCGQVLFAAELAHRGQEIKKALDTRRAVRRNRRARHTRYRKPRFDNRRRPKGRLAPSLMSRVYNVLTWVNRLRGLCPISAISMELVRFDPQAMENPAMEGCQYQQGTLAGYELREYLLGKWARTCAYCGKQNIPLQIEHIIPRAKGGTDRASNLTLACEQCNLTKGALDIAVFLKKKPDVLKRILTQAKAPLKDAAAVNSTRWAIYKLVRDSGLPVECGSGGLTEFNRTTRNLAKAHWLDAACVGKSTPGTVQVKGIIPLLITATGHGCRQMCLMNATGFPRSRSKQKKFTHGFRTGDIVRATVPAHLNNAGIHVGRMSAKAKGGFTITTAQGKITDVGKKYCRVLQRADGYGYSQQCAPAGALLSPDPEGMRVPRKDFHGTEDIPG
jgi:5-methylcytosine-specific restriction endonuclease McrA